MGAAVLAHGGSAGPASTILRIALPLAALASTLALGYFDALRWAWTLQENAYAPMLAALAYVLLGYRAMSLRSEPPLAHAGFALCTIGAALHVLGRSQNIELLTLAAAIPLLAGAAAALGGRTALRALRFPILFLMFSLPYPGWMVDGLTGPLKQLISAAADHALYAAGYPIARSGVILALGHYRLLVADACTGLHSLIFLAALGALYLHLTGRRARLHLFLVAAFLVPIAVLANLLRVLILLLLTYHFGDAAGQSYAHEVAGAVVFLSAFAMLTALDTRLARRLPLPGLAALPQDAGISARPAGPAPRWAVSAPLSALLFATALAGLWLQPGRHLAESAPIAPLDALLPTAFGEWRHDTGADVLLVAADVETGAERLYAQTLARTYTDRRGRRVMLSVAYGARQIGDALQIHRQEFCYQAQGFTVTEARDVTLSTPRGEIPARRLIARQKARIEPVTYWMSVGATLVRPGASRKLAQLSYGLRGVVPDGMLVRVSSLDGDTARAFALHDSFIADLLDAFPAGSRAGIALEKSAPTRR